MKQQNWQRIFLVIEPGLLICFMTCDSINQDGESYSMTLTKNDLKEAVLSQNDLTKNQAANVVDNLIEFIKSTLEDGEKVLISGFGKFEVKEKKSRRGRNPATGNNLILDGRRIVTFKCSDVLRRKLNNEK